MPLDPELVAETRSWLVKAAADLRAAEYEFGAEPPLCSDIVFHCQQAAEKGLKGFLTWHSTPFSKTHSIEDVGEQCLPFDASLKPIVDDAIPLTQYAWKYRYPGEPVEPDEVEARQALALARKVYDAVLARLPTEVYP